MKKKKIYYLLLLLVLALTPNVVHAEKYIVCSGDSKFPYSVMAVVALLIQLFKIVVPIINARRLACYAAIYSEDNCLLEGSYMTLEKLKMFLLGLGKEYIYVSNDDFAFKVEKYNPNILKIVEKYQYRKDINPHLVNPLYLKLTEAEENRLKKDD